MYARVIRFAAQPTRLEEIVAFFETCVVPAEEGQPGFEGFMLLTEEAGGQATAITLWRSREEMEACAPDCVERLQEAFAPILEARPRIEVWTVRPQVEAHPTRPALYFAETSLGIRVPNPGAEESESRTAGTATG